jgi:hypothetical protein
MTPPADSPRWRVVLCLLFGLALIGTGAGFLIAREVVAGVGFVLVGIGTVWDTLDRSSRSGDAQTIRWGALLFGAFGVIGIDGALEADGLIAAVAALGALLCFSFVAFCARGWWQIRSK